MSASLIPPVSAQPDFVCACKEQHRSACAGEPFFGERKGKRYCVLHFPGLFKGQAFEEAFNRKIAKGGDLDFQGVWFPGNVRFTRYTFNEADFTGATFAANAIRSWWKRPSRRRKSLVRGRERYAPSPAP